VESILNFPPISHTFPPESTTMPVMAKHAITEVPGLPPEAKTSVKAAAWVVLCAMGGTSVTFQVWHAVHSHLAVGLAVLFGLAPVVVSLCLSHIAAEHGEMSGFLQTVIYLAVALAMALSMSAVAAVVAPAAGPWQRWLFGLVLDGPSLICLRVVIVQQQRKAGRKAAVEAAERAERDARERAAAEATARAMAEATARAETEAAERARTEAAARAKEEADAKALEAAQRLAANPSKDEDAEAARREYRKSVRDNAPLSDRALGAKFDRSRTWGANRIAEVEGGLKLAQ
jgi:hypothetical protein